MGWFSPRPSCMDTENRTWVVWIPSSSPGQSRACLYLADSVSCFRACSFVFYARFYTIASVSLQVPQWAACLFYSFCTREHRWAKGRSFCRGAGSADPTHPSLRPSSPCVLHPGHRACLVAALVPPHCSQQGDARLGQSLGATAVANGGTLPEGQRQP